jgi:uncharacterized protein
MDDFQVFVKPVGAACNLACSYCYYLDKEQLYSGRGMPTMSVEILEIYIRQHIEASSGQTIFFSWHGGEPTLAGLSYFQTVVAIQKKYLPSGEIALNGIQTNGTLLDEQWCQFLKDENFVVGVSIDGPEEFHSKFRLRKNTTSSYADVLQGIQLLKLNSIPFEVLCVVNAENVSHPLKVYRFLKDLQPGFITFIPLVERLSVESNQVSDRSVQARAFGEFLCTIFDEWKTEDIGKVKVQIFEESLRTAFGVEHSHCIFRPTCGLVPVIEHNGDFYLCDHFVEPKYKIGNIQEKSLKEMLESEEQRAFGQAKLISLPKYCHNCEVLSMCNGACPNERFINTPDGEFGLNYFCEGYRLFFNYCKPFVDQVAEIWKSQQ